MSTRLHIGIWNEDGSLDVIYCHWDGYPSYNGAVLFHHYQEPEKIREFIALGRCEKHVRKLVTRIGGKNVELLPPQQDTGP